MGTNWNIGSSVWTWWKFLLLWGWQSTETGCSQELWSLLLQRYSKPTWTPSCATCSKWPCFSRGGWTRWCPEVLFNPYHSVILWLLILQIYGPDSIVSLGSCFLNLYISFQNHSGNALQWQWSYERDSSYHPCCPTNIVYFDTEIKTVL